MIAWQEPPPYIQYLEEAEALGRMSYMAGFCVGVKMIDGDADAVDEILKDFDRRAILAGTEGPLLNGAVLRGVEREKANINTMMDMGPEGSPGYERKAAQAAEYIGNGCAEVVIAHPDQFKLVGE